MSCPQTESTGVSIRELTIRGIVIGGMITIIFTAANVYLGLKAGLTFATSIPAAVISMAVLRLWSDHTVQENNIVQTIASAAGTLSAVIFVLPGLVIVGWWNGFPYWQTMLVCALGGSLGVMYSIPLRRALVTGSELPYPEGVAGAEILKVGDAHGAGEDNRRGLLAIVLGALASSLMSLLSNLKIAASGVSAAFRLGGTGTMLGSSLSMALIGVGHLVGMTVGVAMLVGMLLSYGVLLPYFASGSLDGGDGLEDALGAVFRSDVRFIGAGVMAVAAVLLITTTIRLSAMSRSKETEIMRLVGASKFFIQLPFVLEGAIAALIGAVAAVGALWAGVRLIVDEWLGESPTFINTAFISTGNVLLLAPWILLAAIVLAVVSSSFSLSKYTRV